MAGWSAGSEGAYVHLSGTQALLQTSTEAPPSDRRSPSLYEANARLTRWQASADGQKLDFSLAGHVPLVFALAHSQGCQVQAGQRSLSAQSSSALPGHIQQFKLPDATAQVQVRCDAR